MADQTSDQPVITQENVVSKESDTKTVVGISALSLPTPDKIKAIFKMIMFFTIVVGLVANGISEIPEPAKKQILEYMAVVLLILQKAEDFWGIKINS